MSGNSQQFSIATMGRYVSIFVVWIWPGLLVLTWLLLLLLSYINGVFKEIPLGLRQGITGAVPRDVPGLLQDPFYTIFQFSWLPFVWLSVRAFRLLSRTICDLWERKVISHERASDESMLKSLIKRYVTEFNQKMSKIRPWIFGILVGLVSMSYQVLIQIQRVQSMDIMYWWDWRISRSIYIVRLLMVGLDMAIATVIVIKGFQVIVFVQKFLTEFKFPPQPLHPDKAGGLASIGRLCLSFVFPVLVVGVTLVTSFMFHREVIYWIINLVIISIYIPIVIGVFSYPLKEICSNMKSFRETWLNRISLEINQVLSKLDVSIRSRNNTSPPRLYSNLDNLTHYYQTIERIPVRPFDLETFSKFIGTILLPVAIVVLGKIVEHFIK